MMESQHLAFSIFILLFVLVFAEESHARAQISDQDYWKAVCPNTAIPSPMQDLGNPVTFGSAEKYDLHTKPNGTYSETFFFNNEIYPSKIMTIEGEGNNIWQWKMWYPPSQDKSSESGNYQELCVRKGSSTEDKYCAESFRTIMDYVISKLGKNVKPLLSSFASKQDQYKVEGVTYLGQKAVMCHRLNFQKVMFYCHTVHKTTAYSVPLLAGDGSKAQGIGVCHFDISGINKKWIQEIKKVDPGTRPICHFLESHDVLWVPK